MSCRGAAPASKAWEGTDARRTTTFLTVSGNRWFDEWRVEARLAALHTVKALWAMRNFKAMAIENPIGVLSTFWRRPDEHHVFAGLGEAFGGLAEADSGFGHWWSGAQQVGWNAIEGEVEKRGRKYRAQWRVKPGLSLLAYGIPRRMERCRGFGNAIVPQVAQVFIEAYMSVRDGG